MKTFTYAFVMIQVILFFLTIELDAQNFKWAKSITGAISGYKIAIDTKGNSFVTGAFQETVTFDTVTITSHGEGDIFIARYDSNGNCLWAKQAGGIGSDGGV